MLKLSGSGNLPLIQAPKLEMPASFEQYNMKTTESLAYNAGGISGYRQFEYPFIPRAEGSYTIAPVEFSYFDPDAARYVTLTTAPFGMEVRPDSTAGRSASGGLVSGVNKEELKILRPRYPVYPHRRPGIRPQGEFPVRAACPISSHWF